MSSVPIAGVCPDEFAAVRAAFEDNFQRGDDIGAAVAVSIDGESVIDLWGGWIDAQRTRAWERDTLTCVFSSTKTVMALCALLLADRGEIDVDAPIRRYWPEFSAPAVTLRHCLAHTAGLPGIDEPLAPEAIYDWEKITSSLARQAPWWTPGTMWAYHGLTQGYLVGEVVRRITGRTIGTFLREELAGPLGADFHIGLGPEHDARVAPIFPGPEDPPIEAPPGTLRAKLARRNPLFTAEMALETPWRRAEIPAGNGYGTARALARLQQALACGGEAGGKRFLSPKGARAAASPSWRGLDAWGITDVGFGLGFALNLGGLRYGTGESCFWGGAGGSLVVVDFERRMSFAYVMNRMQGAPFGDRRNLTLTAALYGALSARSA
jgi:CubicO group peptidase (beta-lactamase class C family)